VLSGTNLRMLHDAEPSARRFTALNRLRGRSPLAAGFVPSPGRSPVVVVAEERKCDSGAHAHEAMHEARLADPVGLRDANLAHHLLFTAGVKRLFSWRGWLSCAARTCHGVGRFGATPSLLAFSHMRCWPRSSCTRSTAATRVSSIAVNACW
jgi:hypothetical protein